MSQIYVRFLDNPIEILMTSLPLENISLKDEVLSRFLLKLKSVYAGMDRKYVTIAANYGFLCQGCEENCCRTRFYHHTLLEYLCIREGFNALPSDKKRQVRTRAKTVIAISAIADRKGIPIKEMCPLNLDGRCMLYAFRPMICRLHGIPHELHRPGSGVRYHPGCHIFCDQCRDSSYCRFDRTPFYIEMAELERELKATVGIIQKIKMTMAEMLSPGIEERQSP